MFLLKFQNQIPPPIVVALFLLFPLTASCGGQYGGKSTVAEPTLTVTVIKQSTENPLVEALVTAELTYKYNCYWENQQWWCDYRTESRAALPTNNQGQVAIPLLSQENSGLPMPTEVNVWCAKPGYKAGSLTLTYSDFGRVNYCSMEGGQNYQDIEQSNVVDKQGFEIQVIDKITEDTILNPQFKFEQSVEGKIDEWQPNEHPTKITVSAEGYHSKTVTVKPDEWPVTIELDKLVYKYSLILKLYDHEGNELKKLPPTAKVSIKFNETNITLTPEDSSELPLTLPIQESKTRSKDEHFSIHIDNPPFQKTVILDLAENLWDYDRHSPGVLKATYHITLKKPKKALVVLVNQANAWESKRSSAWMGTSLIKILNPWWKKQKMFSYFGYGRIAAGVYPRLIHQSEHKAPSSLIMKERMFNAFVEPHLLANFFLDKNDDAIWPKLLDIDDQPKADEWFFILLLPHNTSLPFYATVERYEAYAGEGSWHKKRAQLKASLEKYNAHLYIIEDFFKPGEVECDVANSTTVANSESDGETTAIDKPESQTKKTDNCTPQSTEQSIIEALSDLERISYQAIPYENFRNLVPKVVLKGLLERIEKDVE